MTHYEEFGISPRATTEEIRQAHRNLARLLHPDNFQDDQLRRLAEGQMKRVNRIFHELADPVRRRSYDLQLQIVPAPPPARAHPIRQAAPWMLAAAGVMFGLYPRSAPPMAPAAPVAPVEGASVARDVRKPKKRQAPAPTSSEVSQLAEETRQLRRLLERSVSDRDRAVEQLSSRAAPAAAPAVSPTPPRAVPGREPVETGPAQPANPARTRSGLAGTWLFVPPAERPPNELYPAEYIELVVSDNGGGLSGRYRARYRVADRALSPEVDFRFRTDSPNPERVAWTGNGGAKGEMRLRLLSASRLAVDWFTNEFGAQLTLGSGTAVLVRGDGAVD